MGTRTTGILLRVIDGDTFLVKIGEALETIRLLYVDCEESKPMLISKPVTNAGALAYEFALQYWWAQQPVIEFECDDSLEKCLVERRDYFDRLVCYMWREDENYNLRLVKQGLSPYFKKYGSSIYYDEQFTLAQEQAQANVAGVWNPAIDFDQVSPNYLKLMPYWSRRAASVDGYRLLGDEKIISALANCDNLCSLISKAWRSKIKKEKKLINIFCDIRYVYSSFSNCLVYRVGMKDSYVVLRCEIKNLNNIIENAIALNGYLYVAGFPIVYRNRSQLNIISVSEVPLQIDSASIDVLPSRQRRNLAIALVREKVRNLKNASNIKNS
ncbi:MAG: thermonuclease family protein [Coleofasciculaceae cyanobacterium]